MTPSSRAPSLPALTRATSQFRVVPSTLSSMAIAVFAVSLLLAGYRLVHIERNLEGSIGENIVWLVSQGQFEAVRFADAASRHVAGDQTVPRDELETRFDVLASRLQVLVEGEPRRYLSDLGLADDMDRGLGILEGLRSRITSLGAGDQAGHRQIREALQPLVTLLRDAANRSMLAERERALMLRDARRRTMLEILACVVGVMVSGTTLAAFLVRGRREIARAEASLQREREISSLTRTFVTMVSHQFRTPLAIVDASAQRMLRRGGSMSTDEVMARAAKIREATLRLTRLVESTLDAARLQAGTLALNPTECDLARLVTEACDRQKEIEPGRRIEIDVSQVPGTVRCDPTLIDQVMMNLISNAAKYSPPDSVVQVRGLTDDQHVLIMVEDHGVGIPRDELPRIFERFFRARTTAGVPGTGIGLAFARQIMQLHGGDISVSSREGQGSTFTMRLPLGSAGGVTAQAIR